MEIRRGTFRHGNRPTAPRRNEGGGIAPHPRADGISRCIHLCRGPPMIDKEKTNGEDALAELLRIAGPRPKVAEDVKARVRATVHAEWAREVTRRRRTRIVTIASALAAAAVLGGVLLFRPVPTITPLPQTGTTIETAGESTSIDWGGASLRLDHDTHIRLESDRVAVVTSGAVYYSSNGDSAGVEIRTPFGSVRDIGTQFEVRVDDTSLRVRVREGRVDLRGTIADAGTELIATAATIETRVITRSGPEWAWAERAAPPVVIEGMTLGDVVGLAAREKGLEIDWRADAGARAKRLHGQTPLSPEEAL